MVGIALPAVALLAIMLRRVISSAREVCKVGNIVLSNAAAPELMGAAYLLTHMALHWFRPLFKELRRLRELREELARRAELREYTEGSGRRDSAYTKL